MIDAVHYTLLSNWYKYMFDILEYVAKSLKDRNMTMVSRVAGVSKSQIIAIRDGKHLSPKWTTLKKLYDYIESTKVKNDISE